MRIGENLSENDLNDKQFKKLVFTTKIHLNDKQFATGFFNIELCDK